MEKMINSNKSCFEMPKKEQSKKHLKKINSNKSCFEIGLRKTKKAKERD